MCALFCPSVLAELQQAGLITSEECEELHIPSDVVRVQSDKSPKKQAKTCDVLRRHGYQVESNLLAGEQTQTLIHLSMVCCTVEHSCKGHLNPFIIVSFKHTILGLSE